MRCTSGNIILDCCKPHTRVCVCVYGEEVMYKLVANYRKNSNFVEVFAVDVSYIVASIVN